MEKGCLLAGFFIVSSLDFANSKIGRELSPILGNNRKKYNIGVLEISAEKEESDGPSQARTVTRSHLAYEILVITYIGCRK